MVGSRFTFSQSFGVCLSHMLPIEDNGLYIKVCMLEPHLV